MSVNLPAIYAFCVGVDIALLKHEHVWYLVAAISKGCWQSNANVTLYNKREHNFMQLDHGWVYRAPDP